MTIRSAERHILRGISLTMVFLILAKGMGAIKEMVIAQSYGTGAVVDAYVLATTIAQAPVTLTAMTGNMILIPYFVAGRRAGGGGHDGPLMLGAAGLGLVLSAGVFLLLRHGGTLLHLDAQVAGILAERATAFALMVPSGVVAAVIAARLMAGRRQVNSLCEAIPSAVLVTGLLMAEKWIAADALLAWLSSLGMLAYLLALVVCDRRSVRGTGGKAPSPAGWRGVALVLGAQVVFVASGVLLDQIVAASLAPGQSATLSYTNQLLMLATTLGATAIGRAVLPVLSEARLDADGSDIRLTRRWALGLAGFGTIACAFGIAFAQPLVAALFERGAFGPEDTAAVAHVLRLGLLVLPLYFPSLILSQSAVVQGRFGMLFGSNLAAALCKIAIVAAFIDSLGLQAVLYGALARQAVSLALTLPALRAGRP